MNDDKADVSNVEVREVTKQDLIDEILAADYEIWRAICGNESKYVLYQGPSQNTAFAIAVQHAQGTGHQTWSERVS